MFYLGLNAFSHDASAAIVDAEGRIIAAVEEERFTRKKQDARFPTESIQYCLKAAGITAEELTGIGYAWHPTRLILQRVIWSNLVDYPVPPAIIWKNIYKAVRGLYITQRFRRKVGPIAPGIRVRFFPHHKAHAASAFFASPFDEAAYLTVDGRGEWETVTWGYAKNTTIRQLGASHHPDSLGNFYSGIARFCGFYNLEKDGTVMALAGCGKPNYKDQFEKLLWIEPDARSRPIRLNRDYFDCRTGDAQPRKVLEQLFGIKMRPADGELSQEYKDIAASLQARTQEAIIALCRMVHVFTGSRRLVLAGGVALNSVANGMLRELTPFKEIYIQPAANDSGLSLGCAYLLAHKRLSRKTKHTMESASLGPSFSDAEILTTLRNYQNLAWEKSTDIANIVAQQVAAGRKVAWFQGRLEYGRRALGNRSILADARSTTVKAELNAIKGRESFQPFAVSILSEKCEEWLSRGAESPFMLLVDKVKERFGPLVPGAHHADGSVRVQTVSRNTDPLYYAVIKKYFDLTGVPLIINTSLNTKGQPLACTPDDAVQTLLRTAIDALAIGPFYVTRKQ